MAFTQAFLLQLLLVSLVSATHHVGGKSFFIFRGRNPDGTFRVDFYNKDTYDLCSYSHYWGCYRGNCGSTQQNSYAQGVIIDNSTNAPSGESLWCETESVQTRNLPSDRPFELRAASCCWISTRNWVHDWRLLTSVDLGRRSDSNQPNRPPSFGMLPLLRVPQNCPRTYKLVTHDPDGDKVRCRYGNIRNVECDRCDRPSGFTLNQDTCTLQYRTGRSDYRSYGFEMVVEDFPQGHITLTYSDGSKSYRAPPPRRWKRSSRVTTAAATTIAAATTTTAAPTTTTAAPTTTTAASTTTIAATTTTTAAPTTTTAAPTTTTAGPTTTSAAPTTTTAAPTTTTAAPTTTTAAPTTTTAGPTTTSAAPTTTTAAATTTNAAPTTTTWPWTTTTWPWITTTWPWTTTTWPWTTTTWPWTTTTWPWTTTTWPWTTTTWPWTTTTWPWITTTWPWTSTTWPWTKTKAATTTSTAAPTATTAAAPTTSWPWTQSPPLPSTAPLSKLPLHFSFLVDKPAPSCAPGLYLPKLVSPTPENGDHIHAEVGKEVEIKVRAQSSYSRIDNIIFSGPQGTRKHRTAYYDFVLTWTPTPRDQGQSYVLCFAVEAKYSSNVYQSDMRCVILDLVKKRVEIEANVICRESTMRVEVEKSSFLRLHQDHLRLSDPSNIACSLQTHSNSTHIIAIFPLNACGTQIEEDDNYLRFKNEITTFDNVGDVITRKHLVEVQFYCQYPKRGNVTHSFLAHRGNFTVMEKGFGTFTYQFEFYPNVQFQYMLDPNDYPLEYYLGDRIFLQIEATSSVNGTVLFVESCRAAPYDNPNYKPAYSIIENGCKVDPTVRLHPTDHDKQFRFSFEAFKFIGLHDQVYITCSVLMCLAGDPSTRCAQGCIKSSQGQNNLQVRRKREAVAQTSVHLVSQGPLRLRRSAESRDSPAMNLNLNLVFITGCLLAAVGMISGVVLYKAKTSKVKYQPLATFEN